MKRGWAGREGMRGFIALARHDHEQLISISIGIIHAAHSLIGDNAAQLAQTTSSLAGGFGLQLDEITIASMISSIRPQ